MIVNETRDYAKEAFCRYFPKQVFLKICNIHRKTPVLACLMIDKRY